MTAREVTVTDYTRDALEDALTRKSLGWNLTFVHYDAIRAVVEAYDAAPEREDAA